MKAKKRFTARSSVTKYFAALVSIYCRRMFAFPKNTGIRYSFQRRWGPCSRASQGCDVDSRKLVPQKLSLGTACIDYTYQRRKTVRPWYCGACKSL